MVRCCRYGATVRSTGVPWSQEVCGRVRDQASDLESTVLRGADGSTVYGLIFKASQHYLRRCALTFRFLSPFLQHAVTQ